MKIKRRESFIYSGYLLNTIMSEWKEDEKKGILKFASLTVWLRSIKTTGNVMHFKIMR